MRRWDDYTESIDNVNDNSDPQYTILLVLVFMFESVIGLLAYVYQVLLSCECLPGDSVIS